MKHLLSFILFFTFMIINAQSNQENYDFFKQGICVSGDCETGFGIKRYQDGTIYIGNWWNDMPGGQGTIIWGDGTIYVGDFDHGKYHGDGTFMTMDQFYIGEFRNDAADGQGTFFLKNGVYVGDIADGLFDGKGYFLDVNGNIEEGNFKQGNIIGEIIYRTEDYIRRK